MIVGIGVDTVDIARFEHSLERTPALRERLFTPGERDLSLPSLAARFAAKEALIKALGDSRQLCWQDMSVVRGEHRAPSFEMTGALLRELGTLGADRVHLSMTHDAGLATAFVIVEALAGGRELGAGGPEAGVGEQGTGAGMQGTGAGEQQSGDGR